MTRVVLWAALSASCLASTVHEHPVAMVEAASESTPAIHPVLGELLALNLRTCTHYDAETNRLTGYVLIRHIGLRNAELDELTRNNLVKSRFWGLGLWYRWAFLRYLPARERRVALFPGPPVFAYGTQVFPEPPVGELVARWTEGEKIHRLYAIDWDQELDGGMLDYRDSYRVEDPRAFERAERSAILGLARSRWDEMRPCESVEAGDVGAPTELIEQWQNDPPVSEPDAVDLAVLKEVVEACTVYDESNNALRFYVVSEAAGRASGVESMYSQLTGYRFWSTSGLEPICGGRKCPMATLMPGGTVPALVGNTPTDGRVWRLDADEAFPRGDLTLVPDVDAVALERRMRADLVARARETGAFPACNEAEAIVRRR